MRSVEGLEDVARRRRWLTFQGARGRRSTPQSRFIRRLRRGVGPLLAERYGFEYPLEVERVWSARSGARFVRTSDEMGGRALCHSARYWLDGFDELDALAPYGGPCVRGGGGGRHIEPGQPPRARVRSRRSMARASRPQAALTLEALLVS